MAKTPNIVFIAFDLVEHRVYLGGDIGGGEGAAGKLKQVIQKERLQLLKDSGEDAEVSLSYFT